MNATLQSMTEVDLSIVIPAWNEMSRLPRTLENLAEFNHRFAQNIEVVIADDGSTDGTREIALRPYPGLNLKVVSALERHGPGHAVKRGVLAATGRRILLSDADGPVPFNDVIPLWNALDAGADLAVGSRVIDPDTVLTPQPWYRVVMGRVWRKVAQTLILTGVQDTQCGFKLMDAQCARRIFQRVESTGFGFHVEALFYARRLGFDVIEIPVRWRDVPGSKINLFKDPIVMLAEIFRIAMRARLNARRYENESVGLLKKNHTDRAK